MKNKNNFRFDNILAQIIDPEAAQIMEEEGCDIKFIGPLDPAYRNRQTGVWSKNMWINGSPAGTILALDYNTLIKRIRTFNRYAKKGNLQKWEKDIYLPERAQIVFEKNLDVNDRSMLSRYFPTNNSSRLLLP